MVIRIFKDRKQLAREFCKRIVHALTDREELHLALSGGSTPRIIFETLATEFRDTINWKKLHVYWGDERCVPPEHEESNYKMAKDTFLSRVGIPEVQIHRVKGENLPEEESLRYGQVLKDNLPSIGDIPQFDMIMLGMGDDGHTASIFPHQIELWNAKETCVVAKHPISGQKRISLTGQVINNAKEICFLVTGESKAPKVEELLEPKDNGTVYPASLVHPTYGKLYWYLDQAAASGLQGKHIFH